MKAIYLDAFSGISGNMLLGAFLQAGLPEDYLNQELKKLSIESEYHINVQNVSKNGIQAAYIDVELKNHEHHYEHGHNHHEHHHEHRTFKSIREMIEQSTLSAFVKETSIKIFEVLAVAEGKVHGKPKEEVAFHEVGAVDSIVDIVGSAIALSYFGIEKVYSSPLNTGSGFVKCAHGLMPVPAPATAELLKNIAHYNNNEGVELTTPTGAAFVSALSKSVKVFPENFKSEKIAYGAGTRDLDIPNVIRVYFGECEENLENQDKKYEIIEANIDDMNPQIFGYIYDKLLENGALDVWTTPIYMKKNRPAITLSVLITKNLEEKIAGILFKETTSIGFRIINIDHRLEADRENVELSTRFGKVRGKVSKYHGKIVSVSPEYEDCKILAKNNDAPLKIIQQEAVNSFNKN